MRFDEGAAIEFLVEANRLIGEGSKESVLRHHISASLPLIFVDRPWWEREHATCAEAGAVFHKGGRTRTGFVDTLVGSTAIEYEKDISNPATYKHGMGQVKDYCADLLNSNIPADLIIGVLSDTVRWRAYRIKDVKDLLDVPGAAVYGRDHLTLQEIDKCDLIEADENGAKELGIFLKKHLGREGGRSL
jgi:hypothetical protein